MNRSPVELLVALERECLTVDKALAGRDWEACEKSWKTQRRLTHELDLALADASSETDREAVDKRIERLVKYREGQLKRLMAFNEACATRLATMGRYQTFKKTVDRERRASLLDVST